MSDIHAAEVEGGFDEVLNSLKTFEFCNETVPNLELDELSLKLRSNPHYFVFWYEDRPPIKAVNGSKMIRYLLQYSPAPRTRREIADYKLGEIQTCQALVIFFVEAFITLEMGQTGWSTWATKCINGGVKFAENLIDQGLSLEYLPGVKYLHRWISLHILIVKGKVTQSAEAYNWVEEVGVLPSKSKGLLFAAKSLFLSTLRSLYANARNEGVYAMREVVQLDPLKYEWHYQFGNWLRFSRKQNVTNGGDVPGEEEIKTLWETYDVCDYKKIDEDGRNTALRKMALAGVCQGIAEVIRFRVRKRLQSPFQFGGLDFQCEQEAVDFVREKVECMMTKDAGGTFPEFIRCGEIMSSILPHEYRDYKAAEEYYKKAWYKIPTNSKINHKIGCLYLVSDELRNIPRSLTFLRRAVKSEMSNIPAAIDLLKTLMSSPFDNMEEIQTLLSIYLRRSITNASFSASLFPQLLWLDGCAKFMNADNKIEAVKAWITAQRNNTSGNIFLELLWTMKRYQWNSSLINSEIVKSALTNAVSDFSDKNDSLVLQRLISTLPTSSNRRERLRPLINPVQRPAQESDLDNNWRTSATTSMVSDNGSRVGIYQPPRCQSQIRQFHDHNREYQNSYRRNNNYQRNRTNSQSDRPPSPQSWR